MNHSAWLWFTLPAKWCLTSEENHMKESPGPSPNANFHILLQFNWDMQSCWCAWLKLKYEFEALLKFESDKWLYVFILITVSKAVELSDTPMKYYRHIDKKYAAQKDPSTCQKCHLLNKMLLSISDTYSFTARSTQAVNHAEEKVLMKMYPVFTFIFFKYSFISSYQCCYFHINFSIYKSSVELMFLQT